MKKIIQNIQERKSRVFFEKHDDLINELYILQQKVINNEINLELVPIYTVSCFETFFQTIISEFIDYGSPFIDRINNFKDIRKIDIEAVIEIHNKTVTLGEFIAQLLPYSSFSALEKNMSTMLGTDFKLNLEDEKNIFPLSSNTIHDFNTIYKSVNDTFNLRHILCHEFKTTINFNKDLILLNLANCKLFLELTKNITWNIMSIDIGDTQAEMNINSSSIFNEKENELYSLITLIQNNISLLEEDREINLDIFNESITKWKEYRTLHAKYIADIYKNGTMHSLIYNSDMTVVTIEKIESLKLEFFDLLKRINIIKKSNSPIQP